MLLTFDVVASWQFLLPAQSIGQKTGNLVDPFLQGLVYGAFAHSPRGDHYQGAIRAGSQVDSARDSGLVVDFVGDKPVVVL
jgi:hypothetical protein